MYCIIIDLKNHSYVHNIGLHGLIETNLRRPLQPPNKVENLKWQNLLEQKIKFILDSSWVTNQLKFLKSVKFLVIYLQKPIFKGRLWMTSKNSFFGHKSLKNWTILEISIYLQPRNYLKQILFWAPKYLIKNVSLSEFILKYSQESEKWNWQNQRKNNDTTGQGLRS